MGSCAIVLDEIANKASASEHSPSHVSRSPLACEQELVMGEYGIGAGHTSCTDPISAILSI